MSQQKLVLEEVSQRMGIELPKSGDLSQELQSQPASAADLEEDSQPPEKNPKFQILLIGLALFSTLGVGTILLLWGLGSVTTQQVAKKPDSLTNEQAVKSTPEQQKEVADLKTKLVMEQQKADAARVAAEQAKVSSPSPTPTPSSPPSTTPPIATATATKPIDRMQSSERDKALLASLQQQKQQELTQLASLRQSRQQETSQLASLQQQKQQETSQLASLQQQKQQEKSQLLAARSQAASERQKQSTLRSQRNGNLAKTFSTQPTRVVQRKEIAKAQTPRVPQPLAQTPTVPQQPRLDWEQASSLANYGGTPTADPTTKSSDRSFALTGGSAMSPILRLPVGQVVSGKLVTPFYTLISNGDGTSQNSKASATVTIDKAISLWERSANEVGSGWHLPVGTAIEFELQIADNGMIQAVSKKVTYGNTEISIPSGAFAITGNDNQPLFAQIKEVNGSQLAAADTRTAIFGGAAEIGNVLINSGNSSSVSVGVGTTIATQNNGSPNILGAVFKGAFSPQAQAEVSRANSLASKLQKMSKVGYLLPGTSMRVYVAQAATFQIPTDNSNTPQPLSLTQNYQPTPVPKVARLDNSATSLIVETPTDPAVIQSVTNSGGSNVVAPNPFYISPLKKPTDSPQYIETSTQPQVTPTQPSIQPPTIDSNYPTVPTQPQVTSNQQSVQSPTIDSNYPTVPTHTQVTPTQPSIQPQTMNPNYTTVPTQPPGTPNQSFIPQPPMINPNYPSVPTQPITVQTSQGNYVVK
jgi:hypothetical protein